MQAFNITMHVATLTGYILHGGIITGEALGLFAVIAPVLAIPVVLGAMVFRRLNQQAFRRVVLVLLFLSGVMLTGSGFSGLAA